eukprot:TRINITY_DN19722_c0_g1_i1.p1 TRINITY_DN19722_c0_g1~~TRINITY_DN19722_c0_g1_i1.p1  ORF type:complete len:346 (+),score=71.94 TRINITY_DN19722_c0_g1_i1:77-1114(+)
MAMRCHADTACLGLPPGWQCAKHKLEWFFRRYNPAKVPYAGRIVAAHATDLDSLWAALSARYDGGAEWIAAFDHLQETHSQRPGGAAEPAAPGAPAPPQRPTDSPAEQAAAAFLMRVYREHCPDMLRYLPPLLRAFRGRACELAAAAAKKYGLTFIPPGAPPLDSHPPPARPSVQMPRPRPAPEVLQTAAPANSRDALIGAQRGVLEGSAASLRRWSAEGASHEGAINSFRAMQRTQRAAILALLDRLQAAQHSKQMGGPEPRAPPSPPASSDDGDTVAAVPLRALDEVRGLLGVSTELRPAADAPPPSALHATLPAPPASSGWWPAALARGSPAGPAQRSPALS